MYPPLRYREIPLDEISAFYAPHMVFDNGSSYTIPPLDLDEGPIILEIPKVLPVNAHNRPVDLTQTITVPTDMLGSLFGLELERPIEARLGRFVPNSHAAPAGTPYAGKLILQDADPNAVELILRRTIPNIKWGQIDPPDFPADVQRCILAHSHSSTIWGQYADYWVLDCKRVLDGLIAYCRAHLPNYLPDPTTLPTTGTSNHP